MKRPVVYDITRLLTRVFARTPNGIDRVDFSLANYFLRDGDPRRSGLVMTPLGPRVLSRVAAREAIDNIRRHWGEEAEPESDEQFLSIAAAIDQSFGPAPKVSVARRGQYAEALSWIRRHGLPVGDSPAKFFNGSGVYLNVSQFPLGIDGFFHWLDRQSNVDGVFFIHDLLPIETPEYFRPMERPWHLRRLKTLARYGRAAITSTSITRDSLIDQLTTLGRPDMPVAVAPLPADPTFSSGHGRGPPVGRHPYFIMCGTLEPRKNHLLVLHVWRDLIAQFGRAAPKLLLVGERGWENEHIIDLLDRCPALQGPVIRASGLTTPSLKRLLLGARALLMPSFAEGYGLPVVEAIAAGVPVIASDIPVFQEIGGGRLLTIDPTDGPAWRSAICQFMREDSPERKVCQANIERYVAPDWSSFFDTIEEFLQGLADSDRRTQP
jgi:glycosyltransferase involved in cell wall biosynthesis